MSYLINNNDVNIFTTQKLCVNYDVQHDVMYSAK